MNAMYHLSKLKTQNTILGIFHGIVYKTFFLIKSFLKIKGSYQIKDIY